MKQVWKCDHCDYVNEDRSVVEEHENDCFYKPNGRRCGSCKHLKWIGGEEECGLSFETLIPANKEEADKADYLYDMYYEQAGVGCKYRESK